MLFRKFRHDQRGNILPIFALAIIPVIGFVGAAVDYSRAAALRTSMQAALDATALYLSKEASKLTAEQLSEKGSAYFKALFQSSEAKNLVVTSLYSTTNAGWSVKVSANASVDTTLARVLGQKSVDIGGNAEAVWGIKRLELALALDNTGSMSSNNKMTELKKAAKNLLSTMQTSAKKPGDIKVSIIPFATDVNIDKTINKGATWLDWSEWDAANGAMGCPQGAYAYGDWCWTGSQWVAKSLQVNHDKWNGCVTDRSKDYDVQDTPPTSKLTNFVPHQASNCPVALLPLTYDWTKLNAKVDEMTPVGNTNVTIGLAWGWHSLTSGTPLTEGSVPANDLDKVIILLTDGDNTQNRWSSNQAEIDVRTKKACDNIKAEKKADGNPLYTIYTIRVINGNAALLRGCASSPDKYFDVQNASQLSGVFSQIAKNLANLRLAK